MARRYNSEDSKKRILSACVKLFIEKGYHNTKIAEIMREADVTSSTFQNIFHAKDGVLFDLTEFMFNCQFDMARSVNDKSLKPVYIYAVETSIQLAITELNENLRDIYVEAYSNSKTIEYIFEKTSNELYNIFLSYNPSCTKSDFYELEIGTAGIMRNYMNKKCDVYFSLEKKLQRFLNMTLNIYNVPVQERKEVIEYVLSIDIRNIANMIMQELFKSLAMRFDFQLNNDAIAK